MESGKKDRLGMLPRLERLHATGTRQEEQQWIAACFAYGSTPYARFASRASGRVYQSNAVHDFAYSNGCKACSNHQHDSEPGNRANFSYPNETNQRLPAVEALAGDRLDDFVFAS